MNAAPSGAAEPATQRPGKERSLLARALAHLARREYSRAELARKLARHAQSESEVERLLDDLQAQRLLSDERFTDMLARSRGVRFGAARIQQELRMHRLDDALVKGAVAELRSSEFARARALWQRRFGAPAADAAGRLRQMRFLAARGFASDVIRKVVGGRDDD